MRRLDVLAVVFALSSGLAGCSCGGSSSSGTPTGPRTASPVPPSAARGVTSLAQAVAAQDQGGEAFPGAANTWVLDRDYALSLGYGLEYAYALDLWAGSTRAPASEDPAVAFDQLVSDWVDSAGTNTLLHEFPFDQRADEAVWLSPLFGAADGLVSAVATTAVAGRTALAGSASAFLPGGADRRLVRTVTLAPDQTYTLGWQDDVVPAAGQLAGEAAPPFGPRWQVVLRDPATGAVLGDPLFVSTSTSPLAAARTATFSTSPGPVPAGAVDLSFELRSGASVDALAAGAIVDAVTLSTTGGDVALPNGDFEAGLAPWRAVDAPEPRNVRGGARVLEVDPSLGTTLAVTRTFYAPPAAPWARVVDVFENDAAVEVVTTVVYANALFASGTIPVWRSAAGDRAAVGRDATGTARDVGIVFGSGLARFDPASGVPDLAFVVHRLRVPARGRAALVHFVVQLGQGADLTGADHATAGTDAACQAIADGFRTVDAYRNDLEPGILGLVKNL